ncbi:MAG: sporulation protein YqfD [Firmicutes bacterium]|nr:sporulation protein YqfD [Bacillota bacterium]
MYIRKLRCFFTGYLVIAVHGRAAEKMINLAIRRRIPVWDVQHRRNYICLKIDVDSFFEMRHLARQTACRLKILQKVGLPFFYRRLIKRPGLLIGLCFFVGVLYFLSSMILFIDVKGNENLKTEYILQLAEDTGIRPGIFKEKLKQNEIAQQMLIKEPKLEWVGLHLQGTRLLIEVVEKIELPAEPDTQTNLVAAKDGLVTDVLVVTGEAKVKPGDTVRRGQLLIEGVLHPESPYLSEEGAQLSPVPVRARGEVQARVWYEGYGEAALTESIRRRTGKRITNWTLLVNEQPVLRLGRIKVPYLAYDTETISRSFSKRIIAFPVEIITETYHEVELQEKKLSRAEAIKIATKRAKTLAELQLPDGVEVKDITVEEISLAEGGIVVVRYIVETLENIAVEKTVSGGEE